MAQATYDVGQRYEVLRFSSGGTHALLREVAMGDEEGRFLLVSAQGAVSSHSPKSLGFSPRVSGLEVYEYFPSDAREAPPHPFPERFKAFLKARDLTLEPILGRRSLRSPDKSRYAILHEARSGFRLRLIEGRSIREFGPRRNAPSCPTSSPEGNLDISIAWSPDSRAVIAVGAYHTGFEHGGCHFKPYFTMVSFKGAPPKPLDKRVVAEQLNAQGFRNYKTQKADFGEYYAEAVEWDPTYEVAIYNAACARALAEDKAKAFELLEALKALGTEAARAFLEKAPKDQDFAAYKADPRFIALTQ